MFIRTVPPVQGPGLETVRTIRLCLEIPVFRITSVPARAIRELSAPVRWPSQGWRFESNTVDLAHLPRTLDGAGFKAMRMIFKCNRRRSSGYLFVVFGVQRVPLLNTTDLENELAPLIGRKGNNGEGLFYDLRIPKDLSVSRDRTVLEIMGQHPASKSSASSGGVVVVRNRALQVVDPKDSSLRLE
jgi:hypothetical protein